MSLAMFPDCSPGCSRTRCSDRPSRICWTSRYCCDFTEGGRIAQAVFGRRLVGRLSFISLGFGLGALTGSILGLIPGGHGACGHGAAEGSCVGIGRAGHGGEPREICEEGGD